MLITACFTLLYRSVNQKRMYEYIKMIDSLMLKKIFILI